MDKVTCQMCLNIPQNAVQTTCCRQIFCEHCLAPIKGKPCVICGKYFIIGVCLNARRIIENLPAKCKYKKCSITLPAAELKKLEEECQFKTRKCSITKCIFNGDQAELEKHVSSSAIYAETGKHKHRIRSIHLNVIFFFFLRFK